MPRRSHLLAKARLQIQKAAKDGHERGMLFCEKKGEVLVQDLGKGGKRHLDVPKCPPKTTEIGTFHVHPSGDVRPSAADILVAINAKNTGECIGGKVDGKDIVSCIEFNKDHRGWPETRRRLKEAAGRVVDEPKNKRAALLERVVDLEIEAGIKKGTLKRSTETAPPA